MKEGRNKNKERENRFYGASILEETLASNPFYVKQRLPSSYFQPEDGIRSVRPQATC